jgi:hypothetical protein
MATTTTPNLQLEKKDYGDLGWDTMINQNSDKTDAAITADRQRIAATETEIAIGRGGFADLNERANHITGRLAATESEIAASRGGFQSMAARETDQESKIADLQALIAGSATLSELGLTIAEYIDQALEPINPLAAITEGNRLTIGVMNRELMRQRTAEEDQQDYSDLHSLILDQIALTLQALDKTIRHNGEVAQQHGEITLYNRGRISGATVAKGAEVGEITIAAGQIFGLGRQMPAQTQTVTAEINLAATTVTRRVYLTLPTGDTYPALTLAPVGTTTPAAALEIGTLTMPARSAYGSDALWWAACTLSNTARLEPEWPSVQTSLAYQTITLPRALTTTAYHVTAQSIDWAGGSAPIITIPAANVAANTFRIYLSGSADGVRVRWLTHSTNQ